MRRRILSALYAANAAMQHWLDVCEYDEKQHEEIERITHNIDALRVSIEAGGFDELARDKCRRIGDECGKRADDAKGYGQHLLRFMSLMGGAL